MTRQNPFELVNTTANEYFNVSDDVKSLPVSHPIHDVWAALNPGRIEFQYPTYQLSLIERRYGFKATEQTTIQELAKTLYVFSDTLKSADETYKPKSATAKASHHSIHNDNIGLKQFASRLLADQLRLESAFRIPT